MEVSRETVALQQQPLAEIIHSSSKDPHTWEDAMICLNSLADCSSSEDAERFSCPVARKALVLQYFFSPRCAAFFGGSCLGTYLSAACRSLCMSSLFSDSLTTCSKEPLNVGCFAVVILHAFCGRSVFRHTPCLRDAGDSINPFQARPPSAKNTRAA